MAPNNAAAAMSLEFHGIRHRYGRDEVLRDVALAVPAGEITCLLGPSGSGKSTLLRLAAGLERLQSGTIRLDGELLSEAGREPPPEQRPVGLVFQDHVLFPHKTVRENVAFGLRGLAARERHAVAQESLQAVGLAALAERYPDTLSGGQQQRVALARALAPKPRVMLLDEPFANVDAVLRRALREDARRALRGAGSIALVVTHDPEEALQLADRIAILEAGRVIQVGEPGEIWRTPAAAAVAELFGQAQHLRGTVENGVVVTGFGALPADSKPDGLSEAAAVDVVARPAGVSLRKVEQGACVVDVRFLGDRYLVLAAGGEEILHASMTDLAGIAVGDRVQASFRSEDTFVYPRK